MADKFGWKPGLPPGKYYDGMLDDYEVAFAPLAKWHRRRPPEEAEQHRIARERHAMVTSGEGGKSDG